MIFELFETEVTVKVGYFFLQCLKKRVNVLPLRGFVKSQKPWGLYPSTRGTVPSLSDIGVSFTGMKTMLFLVVEAFAYSYKF